MICRLSNFGAASRWGSFIIGHVLREKGHQKRKVGSLHAHNNRRVKVIFVFEDKLFNIVFYITSVMFDCKLLEALQNRLRSCDVCTYFAPAALSDILR